MAEREQMICKLEEADRLLRQSGACMHWFGDADEELRKVAGDANGHLLQQLLVASNYCDIACVELLRRGSVCASSGVV